MTAVISLLGTVGSLSLILLFYILARLSERFGSVIKMRPLYRYYYVALVFVGIGCSSHLMMAVAHLTPENVPAWLTSTWFIFVTYYLSLSIGVTIGLITTWRYWSWLVSEHNA